jgi:DNA-binding transcriptional MocR family regulator
MSHRPGWSVTIGSIAREAGVSRDMVSGAITELEALGYLLRSQERSEGGRFNEVTWFTSDPIEDDSPLTTLPATVKPATENPALKKNITKKNNLENTNISRGSRIDPDSIDRIEWLEWARKEKPALDADKELANFVDYWQAKTRDATKRDWFATWRVWVRNSRQPAHRPPGEKKTNLQKNLELFEKMFGSENGELNE